jgi:hypothetical protein
MRDEQVRASVAPAASPHIVMSPRSVDDSDDRMPLSTTSSLTPAIGDSGSAAKAKNFGFELSPNDVSGERIALAKFFGDPRGIGARIDGGC